jgi:hypothetical protein
MSKHQLEELRDIVCAALVADSNSSENVAINRSEVIDAIVQIPIRDGVLRYLFDNPEHRANAQQNLNFLLKDCVAHELATVATVLAGCAWLDENYDQTRSALDMALAADSTYSLARLLDVALKHGVPAQVWADSLKAVSPEQCISGAA